MAERDKGSEWRAACQRTSIDWQPRSNWNANRFDDFWFNSGSPLILFTNKATILNNECSITVASIYCTNISTIGFNYSNLEINSLVFSFLVMFLTGYSWLYEVVVKKTVYTALWVILGEAKSDIPLFLTTVFPGMTLVHEIVAGAVVTVGLYT